jgi:hypothetical protein
MRDKPVADRDRAGLSRREFAIFIAAGAACTALPAPPVQASVHDGPEQSDRQGSASSRSAEAEAQYQALIGKYGPRLSDEQRADIRRLIDQGQKSALSLRSFQLNNADEPANVFHAALRS